jgi:DNA-binding GntR family transcriptional regulator
MPPARLRSDEIYHKIKHRLAAGLLRFGNRIDVAALADQLGVSVTPVREALTRLFEEQLVKFEPTRGFSVKIQSAEDLCHLYEWNMMLTEIALSRHVALRIDVINPRRASRGAAPTPDTFNHSSAPSDTDIARQFFLRIAAGAGNPNLVRAIANANDRLAFLRLIEPDVIAGSLSELARLVGLYDAGQFKQMKRPIVAYHRKRIKFIPELLKEALSRSFSGGVPDSSA